MMSKIIRIFKEQAQKLSVRIFKLLKRRAARFTIIALLTLLIIFSLVPVPDEPFKGSYSRAILDRNGRILRVFLNDNEQWCFPSLDGSGIPYKLEEAVLNYEDRFFYYHFGVNPVSILRALYQNVRSGEVISGGSTLTMQLARLMVPRRRSYFNKIIEMIRAVKIELSYSKDDILRMYLEHAPYGRNIIGYRAASLKYFAKLPEKLTWAEAALLAVLPNSPNLLTPPVDIRNLLDKRNRLLKRLLDKAVIGEETYKLALLEAIPVEAVPFEFHAPHLGRMIHSTSDSDETIIRTSVDIHIQRSTQRIVKQHSIELRRRGIENAAVLVVDTKTGRVRAYIGSQDYYDREAAGCVDGVKALRSTGSTLKPFLYALSIDSGAIVPQTMIKDIPSYYSGFSPENASGDFDGLVTARNALTRSLNVPAVRLLNYYGLEDFYGFLREAGLHDLYASPYDYGLPLIIGGVEASLWDMTSLYRGLGNLGEFGHLSFYEDRAEDSSTQHGCRLISRGACYLILDILRDLKRPGAEYYWQSYQNQWPIAWKTGTSYGRRDAWAIGVTPQWTIGVWVGNFNGKGNGDLAGASCAGPILFDIFNSLPKDPMLNWFEKPYEDFVEIDICRETGFRAGPDCENTVTIEVPESMKPLRRCPYHKAIYVTLDEKHSVCSLCWEPEMYKRISRLFLPPDVTQYLRMRGVIVSSIPPHKENCPQMSDVNPLDVVYPVKNARIWIPRDFNGLMQKLTLRAAHRQRGRKIYWYIDHIYKGVTDEDHVIALNLDNGWHSLEIVDEDGNRKKTGFYVAVKR